MTKKILILLLTIFLVSCFNHKTSEEKYLDYIEQGLVCLYDGKNKCLKYFDKAYKQNPNDDLLYNIVNSQLDYENLKKFYSNKKNKAKGYDYYIQRDFLKAHILGNIQASKSLYNEYYYNFEYEKAYKVLTESNMPRILYIYTVLENNKDLFFKIEKIYKKMLDNKASIEERNEFKKFIIKYPVDVDKTYNVLKNEIENKDNTALYMKYLSLDKESVVAIKTLNELVEKNYGPAINEYIVENKITKPDKKFFEKIDKYCKSAYVSLLNNCVEKGDISNISSLLKKIPNSDENSLALAEFYYYYKDINTAYNEYIRAYKYGMNIDYVVYRLINIAKKTGKEKEFLELTKEYSGENESLIDKLKFDLSNNILEKRRYALKIFTTNPKLAASCLLDITKDKKKVNCYTSILKAYK